MSEVRLNLIDARRVLGGTVHGGVADAAVAGLSADPETIEELQAAMARFQKPVGDSQPFATFDAFADDEPWDAGIIYIDLAARVVAVESTYSSPSPEGEIQYHDGTRKTDVNLHYRVPDDWLFVHSIDEYHGVHDRRRAEHLADQPLDARPVLYDTVVEFIVKQCLAAREAAAGNPIPEIHARWLMTPREDLRGRSPREILLLKRDAIADDLQSRQLHWSFLGEPAPCLERDSRAYRFGGFGTHEVVMYYDLLRHLLTECWECAREGKIVSMDGEVARLERVKADWLSCPQEDLGGRTPAYIIDCERRRLPLLVTPEETERDGDCPLCRAMCEDSVPTFCHLDGCNMDPDFPFSFYETRDEWAEEERQYQQICDEFNRESEVSNGKETPDG